MASVDVPVALDHVFVRPAVATPNNVGCPFEIAPAGKSSECNGYYGCSALSSDHHAVNKAEEGRGAGQEEGQEEIQALVRA